VNPTARRRICITCNFKATASEIVIIITSGPPGSKWQILDWNQWNAWKKE
jgi:hypothetical protein